MKILKLVCLNPFGSGTFFIPCYYEGFVDN